MKTISKLLLAVCFLSVVDANAEIKTFKFKFPPIEPKTTLATILEVKQGEYIDIKSVLCRNKSISAKVDFGENIVIN